MDKIIIYEHFFSDLNRITGKFIDMDNGFLYKNAYPCIILLKSKREILQEKMELCLKRGFFITNVSFDFIGNSDSMIDKSALFFKRLRNIMKLACSNLKRKKRKYKEHSIQKSFFDYLNRFKKDIRDVTFSIPNEGVRSAMQGSILKQRGMTAGVPDIFCAIPNKNGKHGLFIEFKDGSNKLTDNQEVMIGRLVKNGYECKICYTSFEAISVLNTYLGTCFE